MHLIHVCIYGIEHETSLNRIFDRGNFFLLDFLCLSLRTKQLFFLFMIVCIYGALLYFLMVQVNKMLKPEKWQATFDCDGKNSGFQKALKLIVLGVCWCTIEHNLGVVCREFLNTFLFHLPLVYLWEILCSRLQARRVILGGYQCLFLTTIHFFQLLHKHEAFWWDLLAYWLTVVWLTALVLLIMENFVLELKANFVWPICSIWEVSLKTF